MGLKGLMTICRHFTDLLVLGRLLSESVCKYDSFVVVVVVENCPLEQVLFDVRNEMN